VAKPVEENRVVRVLTKASLVAEAIGAILVVGGSFSERLP
jgi:hypothetical protein